MVQRLQSCALRTLFGHLGKGDHVVGTTPCPPPNSQKVNFPSLTYPSSSTLELAVPVAGVTPWSTWISHSTASVPNLLVCQGKICPMKAYLYACLCLGSKLRLLGPARISRSMPSVKPCSKDILACGRSNLQDSEYACSLRWCRSHAGQKSGIWGPCKHVCMNW